MELLRTSHLKESTILVFLGFILSSSLVLHQPLQTEVLLGIHYSLWNIVLIGTLVIYLLGFAMYLFTDYCYFVLQINQYLLVPFAIYCAVQRAQIYKLNSATLNDMIQLFVIVVLILLLNVGKIISTNQTFPGQSNKQILQFEILLRIFRNLKMCINYFGFLLFDEQNFFIVSVILNILDFVITIKQTTFIKLELEQALILANCNNLFSILVRFVMKSNNLILDKMLSQIFLIFLFVFIPNCVRFVMQMKLLTYFSNIQLNRSDFQKEQCKKILILLLECYNTIFNFNHQTKIILALNQRKQWSYSFIYRLKRTYSMVIFFYLLEATSQLNYHSKNSNRQIHLLQLEQKIIQKYAILFGDKKSFHSILQQKKLFFNVVAFCMDTLQQKTNKNLPWSYSNQFFLVIIGRYNKSFIFKKMHQYCRRLNLTDQSIIYKARNNKVGHYLKFYKHYYGLRSNLQEQYMLFEHSLKKLNQKFTEICNQQIVLFEKLVNPLYSTLKCQSNFRKRQKNKQSLLNLFQNCFKKQQYLYFQEFTYLYLLFMIIFCKSIYKTSQKIRQKFIIPKRNSLDKLTYIAQKSILVCYGLQCNPTKFGQIIISNTNFRKQFGFSFNDTINQFNRKINDLIVGNQQKLSHLNLMIQSNKFSENLKKKTPHKQYECFLKINLECDNFHILKQFRVDTRIFFGFFQNILYICQFQSKNENFYTLANDFKKILQKIEKIQELKEQQRPIIKHHQLKSCMNLIKLRRQQFLSLNLGKQIEAIQLDNSMDVNYNQLNNKEQFINEQEQKFFKIQIGIWQKTSKHQHKLLKYIMISFIFVLVSFVISLSFFLFCQSRSEYSMEVLKQIKDVLMNTSGSFIQIATFLNIKRNIFAKLIQNNLCSPTIQNIQQFAQNRILLWNKQRIIAYFSQLHNYKAKIIPILDENFVNFQNLTNPNFDYSNHIFKLFSISQNYLFSNFNEFTPQQSRNFNDFILTCTDVDQNSFWVNFLAKITKLVQQKYYQLILQHKIIYLTSLICVITSLIGFLTFLFKSYVQSIKYFELLQKVDELYLCQRIQQMKYINKQISSMHEGNFKKIQFISNSQIRMQINTRHQLKQLQVDLNQFEKIPKVQQNTNLQFEKPLRIRSILISILTSKKRNLLIILIFCSFLVTTTILLGDLNQKTIQDCIKVNKIIEQGQQIKLSLFYIHFANWNNYLYQSGIRPFQQNQQIIEKLLEGIQKKQFFNIILLSQTLTQLSQTIYIDICSLIESTGKGFFTKDQCKKQLKQSSQLRIGELLNLVMKNQLQILQRTQSNSKYITQKLCFDINIIFNYFQPGITSIWQLLFISTKNKHQYSTKAFKVILYVSICLFFLYISYQFFDLYQTLTKVIKFQVLTIDTAKDLYDNIYFKPYLNRILYQHFK